MTNQLREHFSKEIEVLEHIRYVLGQPNHEDYDTAQYFEANLPMHILEGEICDFGKSEWLTLKYVIENFTGDLNI